MPFSLSSLGDKPVEPYTGVIHKIEVPICADVVRDASDWLRERLGDSAMMARPTKDLVAEPPVAYDPTYLFCSEYLWDAYVDPASFKAFFQIKGNDSIALLFKLTFGEKTSP